MSYNPLTTTIICELEEQFPGRVTLDIPLNKLSRWRTGGLAKVFIRPESISELQRLRCWLTEKNQKSIVIGDTSNLLFSDEGLDVICIKLGAAFNYIDSQAGIMTVGGGAWVPMVARKAMQSGIAGLEHICGIPGTMGGLVCMNGGSMRHGISDAILTVCSVNADGELCTRNVEQCQYNYRSSLFQSADEVVVNVTLSTGIQDKPSNIRKRILGILSSRREKFPRKLPNCGSVFVSDPVMYEKYGPPGKVIESLGMKGFRLGGAQISKEHANFIVNTGGALSEDILEIIRTVKNKVKREYGLMMIEEVRALDNLGFPRDI